MIYRFNDPDSAVGIAARQNRAERKGLDSSNKASIKDFAAVRRTFGSSREFAAAARGPTREERRTLLGA